MMVGVGQQFAGLFGGSVGGDGIVDIFFLRELGVYGSAVNAARGCKYKVLKRVVKK